MEIDSQGTKSPATMQEWAQGKASGLGKSWGQEESYADEIYFSKKCPILYWSSFVSLEVFWSIRPPLFPYCPSEVCWVAMMGLDLTAEEPEAELLPKVPIRRWQGMA